MLGTWWVSPFWSLACSHSFSAALLPFFSTFVFLSPCPCFLSHEGGLAFLCGARSVRTAVFSLTCLSCPSFVFLRYCLSSRCYSRVFCVIVNPSSFNLGAFFIPGICLRLSFLSCGFANLHLVIVHILVLVSVCRVGAEASAVSSVSYPSMCAFSLPGLLTGCHALSQVDTWHTTVDCLLLASSAAML